MALIKLMGWMINSSELENVPINILHIREQLNTKYRRQCLQQRVFNELTKHEKHLHYQLEQKLRDTHNMIQRQREIMLLTISLQHEELQDIIEKFELDDFKRTTLAEHKERLLTYPMFIETYDIHILSHH